MHQREVYKTCCYGFWQNGVGQQPQTKLNEVLGNLGRLDAPCAGGHARCSWVYGRVMETASGFLHRQLRLYTLQVTPCYYFAA
jgi:hypothetical protein